MKSTLKRQLSNVFKINKGIQLEAMDIMRQYRNRKGLVVLEHTIDGTDWDKHTEKLLDWYINSFWNIEYDVLLPQFLVFINVKYPLVSGGFFKRLFSSGFKKGKIKDMLSRIAAKFPECCRSLPELSAVRINDVNNWIDQYGESQLDYLLEEIFSDDKDKRQPMRTVENHLEKGLEKLRKQRDRQLLANL